VKLFPLGISANVYLLEQMVEVIQELNLDICDPDFKLSEFIFKVLKKK
jgi:hypothetical protein